MLLERLICRLCGGHFANRSKGDSAAVPKLRSSMIKTVAVDFASPEKRPKKENINRLKLVIRTVPEDGWYIVKPKGLLKSYMQLSKAKLTALITTTAVGGFVMAPQPLSLSSLGACAVGTALLSACANTFNHLLETPYDAQMKRTQSRLLVVHRFTPLHAVCFATVAAAGGFITLWLGCNALTAGLGALNAALYAGVYTPMKRYSIACTWAGAIVGAIPPLMGYAGASGIIEPASLVLAAILYSWQFPHFNALSWNLRSDYTRAGYSLAVLLLCSLGAPLASLTPWSFAAESLPLNGVLCYLSYRFFGNPGAKTARTLFLYTLLHLPLIMMLMVVSKFGHGTEEKWRRLDWSSDPSL